jgi:formylglycine-generating enzyme required for sulfatase activity
MKNTILILFIFLLTASFSFANNTNITNVTLTGQNTTDDYTMVQFDISWENSWRNGINWDASWVFVKYKLNGVWYHATLNTSGYTAPSGSSIDVPTDGKGAFIYRDDNTSGTFSKTGVNLRWNYGIDGVADNASVTVKVIAIEMVYVPTGSFALGSGGEESAEFYKYPTATSTYAVGSESAITVGTATDNLYYPSTTYSGDQAGPIPADFPKGYNAFYCMKYEITQEQYTDFLNILTRAQQDTRTYTDVSSGTTSVTNFYVMGGASSLNGRNGIRCDATIHTSNPITFYCDYNSNGTGNESGDGQNIACNTLGWLHGAAYADWAGLRPMTELEFEKACRGDQTPVANEHVWGTTNVASSAYTLSNPGAANEGINTNYSTTAGNGIFSQTDGSINGPLRVGIFAANGSNSGRETAGASYYGIMELSGNLWERPVTVGNSTGRAFTGTNGDGSLATDGNANTSNWPGTDAIGSGFRGSSWYDGHNDAFVSFRGYGAQTGTTDEYEYGFRAVRIAP